jgi:hypothetical protein
MTFILYEPQRTQTKGRYKVELFSPGVGWFEWGTYRDLKEVTGILDRWNAVSTWWNGVGRVTDVVTGQILTKGEIYASF